MNKLLLFYNASSALQYIFLYCFGLVNNIEAIYFNTKSIDN